MTLDNRDMRIKIGKNRFIEVLDFGYAQEIWQDDFAENETWKNIRTKGDDF